MQTHLSQNILDAATLLRSGSVVAVPTETVYGLAANALNEEAVLEIFSVKNRPHFDPLIVHVANVEAATLYIEEMPAMARQLFAQFSPGPLTILLPKKKIIPDLVTSGLNTVGIRIPAHRMLQALLRQLNFPLAAPSANPFGYISPTTAQHVLQQLNEKIPLILDGGPCAVGVESTIIGFENNEPVIYRLGGLEIEAIEKVVGKVRVQTQSTSNPQAPGQLQSHYAPRKKMSWLFPLTTHLSSLTSSTAIICFREAQREFANAQPHILSPQGDLNEAARNLFAVMRALDEDESITLILAERFPDEGLGRAVNDRIERACAA